MEPLACDDAGGTALVIPTGNIPAGRHALALTPDDASALEAMGRGSGEGQWFWRAAAAAPDFVQAWINAGAAIAAETSPRAARALKRALALAPSADAAWFNLGVALAKGDGARTAYRRTLVLDPLALDATSNLGDVLREGDPLIAALTPYRRAHALAPGDARILKKLMFCAHYDPDTESEELFRLYRRWAALQVRPGTREDAGSMDPERRLRVGYLSADLYDHPVGRNLIGLIENHDPARIETFVYAEHEGNDWLTERMRTKTRAWRSTVGLDDATVARQIHDDGIDILVMLAGHTPFNRQEVAALKPAPMQVGMHDFTTSGLSQVDYFFSDAWLSPEGGEERFSEKVIRLPSFYLHLGLPEVPLKVRGAGPIVLGSCSNPAKLNDRVIELWARVLAAIPEARLHLKYRDRFGDPAIQQRWRAILSGAGIVAERVVFAVGDMTMEEHLAVVGGFDIALDPFPFNGCTTTYEALWMGVPVVSLVGARFVGRTSLAMLSQLGLADLAVETEAAYVQAAVELAGNVTRRARLRLDLRDRLKNSPLLDAPAYARGVEALYRQIWRGWCDRRPETKERKPA